MEYFSLMGRCVQQNFFWCCPHAFFLVHPHADIHRITVWCCRSAGVMQEKEETEELTLDSIRDSLIRQEDSIIYNLLERAQYCTNPPTYAPGVFQIEGFTGSLIEFLLRETERLHASVSGVKNQHFSLSLIFGFMWFSILSNQTSEHSIWIGIPTDAGSNAYRSWSEYSTSIFLARNTFIFLLYCIFGDFVCRLKSVQQAAVVQDSLGQLSVTTKRAQNESCWKNGRAFLTVMYGCFGAGSAVYQPWWACLFSTRSTQAHPASYGLPEGENSQKSEILKSSNLWLGLATAKTSKISFHSLCPWGDLNTGM